MLLDCTRILLATEHTEFDVGAERAAFALAHRPGVTVSAVVPLVTNVEYETIAPALVAHDEEQAFARSVAVRTAASAAGVAVETRVRRADAPWRAILAEAEECAAELIVVRRRGHRGFLANLMVGEMVDKVATLAPCHVLIVPRAAALPAHRVLAGIDQTRAGPEVARVAARMAVAAGLPLTLMSVALDDSAGARAAAEKTLDAAAHIAREAGASVDTRVEHGRAADAIAATAAATGSDLVVAGRGGPETHGRRLRLGGNAHRIVGLVPCAVLVVKP